jgi:DNA-binding MarR family transcriptional regulator
MSQIHKKLHVSKSTVTTLVDGLVSDGLIERQRTQADRRKIMMSATEAGCNVLEVVREHRCSLVAAALEGVNQDEQARIAAALTTMKQNLNAREAQ